MSRTVGSVLMIAAAIAVNVIPGVGQVISGALISAGLASAAAVSLAGTLIAGVTLAGISAAGSLLGLGPKAPKPETASAAMKTAIPPRVSAYGRSRLWGSFILYETASNGTAVDVYAVHDGPIDGIERRYLGDKQVTVNGANTVQTLSDKSYQGGVVKFYTNLGALVGSAFSAIVSLLPGKWTSNHRGDGVVTMAVTWQSVKADKYQETYPGSGPAEASIVARWQRCFDPRQPGQSPTDPLTWTWTENAALHLLHYRLVREKAARVAGEVFPSAASLGLAWSTFFAPTVDYWIAAANVCDQMIPLKGGGTERRYRSCFAHKHNVPHKDNIAALTACFDGWTCPRADGAIVVYAGEYEEPTVTIGPQHIVAYTWEYGLEDESAVNEIPLFYVSAAHDYATVEADTWRDEVDIAETGRLRSEPLDNPVPSHAQARRLAKRLMSRVRAPSRGTVTTNVAGRVARGLRYIWLRIEEAGAVFYDGPAEITQLVRNLSTGGVTFSWVAADPNIDEWNPATEEGAPATVGDRVAPDPLAAPDITAASIVYAGATDEGTGARVQVTAAGPDRSDLIWFVRWRAVSAAIWNEQRYSDIDPGPAAELLTDFVPVNADIEVQAAYQVGDGRISDWSTPPYEVTTDTYATAPDAAPAPELIVWADTLSLTVGAIPRAAAYRWRFYADDGVTLKRQITTATRSVAYTSVQAAIDGALRAYIVRVAGLNNAGEGAEGELAVAKPAPAVVTGAAGVNGAGVGQVTFDTSADTATTGYAVHYATTTGFNPLTQGYVAHVGRSPALLYNLAAGTYYARVAAFDAWSRNPALLNLSAETSFTLTAGGGQVGAPEDGGGGGYEDNPDQVAQ